jgi:hypothetical protein
MLGLNAGLCQQLICEHGAIGMKSRRKLFVFVLALWLLLSTLTVTALVWPNPRTRAVLGMGWGLIVPWIFVGGGLMYHWRDAARVWVLRVPLDWRLKFVLFATALALVEEAITTTMTNLAPLFGVKVGEAYITASANYLDVVGLHSVIVFVPLFVGWAALVWRYGFDPFEVFLLFGITGTIAEMSFGPQHALEFGMWIFVYGLMGTFRRIACRTTEKPALPSGSITLWPWLFPSYSSPSFPCP